MQTIETRFWLKVGKNGPVPEHRPDLGQCWLWTDYCEESGYGRFYTGGKRRTGAHRFSYELAHGSIPDGLHIDHLCRTPRCVRPSHLEAVTPGENTRRGDLPKLLRARSEARTRCKDGHLLTPDNVSDTTTGERKCKTCARLRARAKSPITGRARCGPLRRIQLLEGLIAHLECGHVIKRTNWVKSARARCSACDVPDGHYVPAERTAS